MRSENTVTRNLYMYIFGVLLIIVLNVSQHLTLCNAVERHVSKPPRNEFDRAALAALLSEPPQR